MLASAGSMGARWREMVLQNRGRREDTGAAMELVVAASSAS